MLMVSKRGLNSCDPCDRVLSPSACRLSLSLQTGHCAVSRGKMSVDVYDIGLSGDGHRIFSLTGLVGKFPYAPKEEEGEEEEGREEEERRVLKHMELKENTAM